MCPELVKQVNQSLSHNDCTGTFVICSLQKDAQKSAIKDDQDSWDSRQLLHFSR